MLRWMSSSAVLNGNRSVLDLALDLLEAANDRVALGGAEQPDLGQHAGVRPGTREILSVEPLVEADRGVYLLHQRGRPALEMAAPQIDPARPRVPLLGAAHGPARRQCRGSRATRPGWHWMTA